MTDESQGSLIEFEDGEAKRDKGIAQVLENEKREEYRRHFARAFERARARLDRFTSEDVVLEIPMDVAPHHPNVIGALMRSHAVEAGLVLVGYVKAGRPSRHAAPIALWGKGA